MDRMQPDRPTSAPAVRPQRPVPHAATPRARPPAPPDRVVSATQILSLQASAGNRAVQGAVQVPALQRKDGDEETAKRLRVLERKDEARAVDAEWQPLVLAHVADRKSAVYRVSKAFQTALSSFQSVQTKQAQTEAVMAQWAALGVTLVAATAYEPIFDRVAKRKWFTKMAAYKDWIENPFNALVQGGTNVAVAKKAVSDAQKGQPPSSAGDEVKSGDPVSFLTGMLEGMEAKTRDFELAFSTRAREYSDPKFDWEKFNAAKARTEYQAQLKEAEALFGDAKGLRAEDDMANVIERHLWAQWIRFMAMNFQWTGGSFGATINRRLNQLGIPQLAGAERLDDNYIIYCSTSRSEFKKIGQWSGTYADKLAGAAAAGP